MWCPPVNGRYLMKPWNCIGINRSISEVSYEQSKALGCAKMISIGIYRCGLFESLAQSVQAFKCFIGDSNLWATI